MLVIINNPLRQRRLMILAKFIQIVKDCLWRGAGSSR